MRKKRLRRRRLISWAGACLLAGSGVMLSLWMVGPACPKRIVIASGGADGAYFAFAQQYQEILAANGVTLEVRQTAGSVENMELLCEESSGVSLALVQGGVAAPGKDERLRSLGSMFLEPVWVFHRPDVNVRDFRDLADLRVAIGPQGSGTRALVQRVMAEHNIDIAEKSPERLAPISGNTAADALLSGKLDAAVFIVSPTAPLIEKLLRSPDVRVMSFNRQAALKKRMPYLSSVTLSEGQLDLAENVPKEDVALLAPAASLVARADLHPALVPLLLRAAKEVHGERSLLADRGAFPSPEFVDVPLLQDAQAWYNSGPTLLFRHLPFAVAAWLSRTKVVLLPLCTLLLPLFRVAPPLYRWTIRSKIYRWYAELRAIDQKLMRDTGDEDFSGDVRHLEAVERELSEVSVPLSYMQEFYNLRLHVSFVLKIIARLAEARDPLFRARRRDTQGDFHDPPRRAA